MSSTESEQKFYGSCQCATIKVVLSGLPINAIACHCIDCQKSAGGPYQTCVLYSTEKVELIDPQNNAKKYMVPKEKTGSGVEKEKWFCGVCGTPLYNRPLSHNGEKTVVKTGILDAPEGFKGSALNLFVPITEIYTKDRVAFVNPIEGAKQFDAAR